MGDDWKPGDLALCVRRAPVAWGWEPKVGGVYTVEECGVNKFGQWWLDLIEDEDGFDEETAFDATYFRKIRPHTPDAEDAETIALLNGSPLPAPPAPPKTEEVG